MKEKATHEIVREQQDGYTGDIRADVLAYVKKRGIVTRDHIGLMYTDRELAKAVAELEESGKLSGDSGRIWLA